MSPRVSRALLRLTASIVVATTTGMAVPGRAVAADEQVNTQDAPLRIMLVGDSQTIGSAGDFTWRYRLDRHLRAAGVAFDFVGPRDDVVGVPDAATSAGSAYADPDFDRDHHAAWGRTLFQMRDGIAEAAHTFDPDVYVVLGGTNDLSWWQLSAEETASHAAGLVQSARTVTPDAAFVLAEPPRSDWPREVALAEELAEVANDLDAPDSRVLVAHTQRGYTESDTYDGGHPHAGGEVKIAAGIPDALAALGVGPAYRRPLPAVPLGPRSPARVTVAATGVDRATLSLTSAPGTTAEIVWHRDVTAGGSWQRLPVPLSTSTTAWSWSATGLTAGHSHAFRLQPMKGRIASEVRSSIVTAHLRPSAPRRVAVRLAPRRVAVLSWAPADGASDYLVQRRASAGGWVRVASTARTQVRLTGQRPRARYVFRVVARGENRLLSATTRPVAARF